MLKKRIIPCLDIMDGKAVKGTNFKGLKVAGDPVELAKRYSDEGADELVFLDISATIEKRSTLVPLVEKVARAINIPFTVGGGIGREEDVKAVINAGADKIGVNSAAVAEPELIARIASQYGSQCVVVAIDTKRVHNEWQVFVHGGSKPTGLNTFEWARKAEELGAGEILLTSIEHDGMKSGFAINLTDMLSQLVHIPVIASGGAGHVSHFVELFTQTRVNAALAASILHYGEVSVSQLKQQLFAAGIAVRPFR